MRQCRHCDQPLQQRFADLGFAPPSNAYIREEELFGPETYFPLRTFVCSTCWLVQTEDFAASDELFDEKYAYFSSVSSTWLQHAKQYCDMITERLNLNDHSLAIELASNDGYLLKNFVENGVPCLGVEPTASTAAAARKLGVEVVEEFFSTSLAELLRSQHGGADLVIGNNVYAHVPDINDFTRGISHVLKPEGVVTLEFPHLLNLLKMTQFDTIYHEHYSYLSLHAVAKIFAAAGLRIFDVEALTTHGGSLRLYGCLENSAHPLQASVARVLAEEKEAGLCSLETYEHFQTKAETCKNGLLRFLLDASERGEKVYAYGAAAKGNTLLNFAGVKPDLLTAVYDAAPSKQGQYLPGSHIPIRSPERIKNDKPDWLLILPWNLADEITSQHGYVRDWGCRFAVAVPEFAELP